MMLDAIQQVIKTLEAKNHVLITTKTNPGGDSLASVLAFYLLLKKMGKKATIAIDTEQFQINKMFDFLPEFESIQQKINKSKDVIIEFDIENSSIKSLTYKIKNNKLTIHLFPENGELAIKSPKIKNEEYDAILVLDSEDLDSLGKIYGDHTEFFYHTSIINIDHKPENEHFGEVNLVELTATSTSEIIFSLASKMGENFLDDKIATCALTGIIHESKSFQSQSITPRALAIASELITMGADRNLIVQKLFYNKPVGALQLWGRVLANLKTDENATLSHSVIQGSDFEETKTDEQELLCAVEDLIAHAPESKAVALLYPKGETTCAIVHTSHANIDLRKKLYRIKAHGNKNFVKCEFENTKNEEIIETIRTLIAHE